MSTLNSFRTLAATLTLVFLTSALGAQCVHPDYDGLEKFYTATNGDAWTDKTGWLSDCEPCGWKGIECDADGRVVTIRLRENGLTGTLPADMSGLTKLSHLAIPRNEVGGALPASLYSLSGLRDLNLARNKFTGGLSNDVAQLTELEFLRIGRNQFGGALPADLASCTRLQILTIEENSFSERIPDGLGDLPNLQAISFFNNDFGGCFPEDLADLCGRTRASFGGNAKLTWEGDFTQLCLGNITDVEQTGAPCDDGDPNTGTDVITEDCLCGGSIDTDGITGSGPEVAGFTETDELAGERLVRSGVRPGVVPATAPEVARLTAFPNPLVGGTLNVRLPESMTGAEVRLLSLTGREITRMNNASTGSNLSVPVLEAGVYLLEAVAGADRSVTRVIVQ